MIVTDWYDKIVVITEREEWGVLQAQTGFLFYLVIFIAIPA